MLKPFYQGKLDAFCAVYAVLNGLRLVNGIRTTRARDILNDVLLNLALKPAEFSAFLNQKTDYVDIVDNLLESLKGPMHLEVSKPFEHNPDAGADEFWDVCADWLGEDGIARHRAVVFRFLRFVELQKPPFNRHWTTADYVKKNTLHLFDCSHEAEAILNVDRKSFATSQDGLNARRLLLIPPVSVRFMSLA